MEIRHLRAFFTVAKFSSFNRAAKHLNYAQSSVSAQIKTLEEDLNVKLFDRLGRRILLTEAGSQLLRYVEKILDLTEETRAKVANIKEPCGSLTIRIPETLGVYRLTPIIKEYSFCFPNIRLKLTTCAHEGLEEDLRKGLTDLAFLFTDSIQTANLRSEPLGFEQLVIVAHPDHPLVKKRLVKNQDLENETNLLSKVDCSYRRIYQQILDQKNIQLRRIIEFNSVAAIKRCITEGLGISILPKISVTQDIAKGKLAALAWEEGEIEVAQLMIWYENRWISPALEALMDISRKMFYPQSESPPAKREASSAPRVPV